ncbi:MAG: NUDIX domain-containing protein [Pseudomonadota bacterium]
MVEKKSELQTRAERAAGLFKEIARKPVVIEFAGVPKAGKTTTLLQLQTFLRRCGFRVEVVVERASVCPIRDKKHVNFNIWTVCTTLTQILEKTQNPPRADDPHILILDRGIFDSICWLQMMERLQRIRPAEREIVEQFLRIDDWRKRISAVILMITSPRDAMLREQGLLPVASVEGSIMNEEVLGQMVEVAQTTAERLKDAFRVFTVDTSTGRTGKVKTDPKKTAEMVTEDVLSVIEEQLQEDILSLPKNSFQAALSGVECVNAATASRIVALFEGSGEFLPRQKTEEDFNRVQALPVVIVRNASGDVLQLRRREKTEDNPLHEKVVIWAGGHVRKEDAAVGSPILHCMIRELEEELRLRVEPETLNLLGAVYVDMGGSTSRHAALVYEWRARTDDVAVALSHSEFFERRGTSLSGRFVGLNQLAKDVEGKKIEEVWSDYIVRELLAKGSPHLTPRLL